MAFTALPARRHRAALLVAALLAIGLLGLTATGSQADDGPPGITKQTIFPPFNPAAGADQGARLRPGQ
jgi:hypothetical protein